MAKRTRKKPPPESSPAEFRRFAARWRIAGRAEAEELRAMSPADKFRQLKGLWGSARLFKWPDEERETAAVRSRWNKLRKVLGG